MSEQASEYFVVRRGATALRNETVWDEAISYGALGILARALATPPGADMGYRAFMGRGMGEKAVRAAMRELAAAGYRHQFTVRRAGGLLRTAVVFSDVPISVEEALAEVVLPAGAAVVDRPDEGPQNRRSHRAATGAARSDQGFYDGAGPVDDPLVDNLSDDAHRAATGAARCDLGKQVVSAGRTAPHSTVARSSKALSLRDTKTSSSLRSEEGSSIQTGPARAPDAPAPSVGSAPVGSGGADEPGARGRGAGAPPPRSPGAPGAVGSDAADGAGGAAAGAREGRDGPGPRVGRRRGRKDACGASGRDRGAGHGTGSTPRDASKAPRSDRNATDVVPGGSGRERRSDRLSGPQGLDGRVRGLLADCLPEWMLAMDPAGARAVAGLLAERLEAGWRPAEVRTAIGSSRPDRVGRMSSLVASRLRTNVDPAMAPALLVAAAQDARREASQRRADALAQDGPRRRADPRFAAAMKRAREALGEGASHLDVALEAQRLLDARHSAGAVAGASP